MFGVPAEREVALKVYHDESGTYAPGGPNRWLLHGVLLVPEVKQDELFAALQAARDEVGYWQEVHYRTVGKSALGPKVRCCTKWLDVYALRFSESCFYHCLALDTESPAFRPEDFGEGYHAYNYFAKVAVVGAIAWCLKGCPRVALKLHSHEKARPQGDNFETYLPREVCTALDAKREDRPAAYPEIRLLHSAVLQVGSDPASAAPGEEQECEFTQLVDLVTSSIGQVLSGGSGRRGKIALAELVAGWVEDTRKPPWLQTKELHRRFSLSCFPDKDGRFYDPRLATRSTKQATMFDGWD